MKSLTSKFILIITLLLTVVYIYGEIAEIESFTDSTRPFFVLLLTLLYLFSRRKMNFYFLMFLILYALGDLCNRFVVISSELNFFVANSIYILSFLFLIIDMFEYLTFNKSIKEIIRENRNYIIVLILINVILAYVLLNFVYPYHTMPEMMISIVIYVIEIIFLLSLAILNVIVNSGKRRWLLLLAYIAITLSEIMQILYIYYDSSFFSVVNILLMLTMFYLLTYQAILHPKAIKE